MTWASSTPRVATISNAAGPGSGHRGRGRIDQHQRQRQRRDSLAAPLTVTAATLVSIAVTPPNPSIAKGLTQQFTATGTYHRQLDAEPDRDGDLGLGDGSVAT